MNLASASGSSAALQGIVSPSLHPRHGRRHGGILGVWGGESIRKALLNRHCHGDVLVPEHANSPEDEVRMREEIGDSLQ
jgi:hypothetical protein